MWIPGPWLSGRLLSLRQEHVSLELVPARDRGDVMECVPVRRLVVAKKAAEK